jgi:hypothetical protein
MNTLIAATDTTTSENPTTRSSDGRSACRTLDQMASPPSLCNTSSPITSAANSRDTDLISSSAKTSCGGGGGGGGGGVSECVCVWVVSVECGVCECVSVCVCVCGVWSMECGVWSV